MPYSDPEKRRQANAERMRRRRAEGTAWEDPAKEAERKALWYYEKGGKAKIVTKNRERRQRSNEQGLMNFSKKLK